MHRRTWSLPVIDYPSTGFDMASLENSAIELETRKKRDQCFYNTAEVCHKRSLQLNGKVKVKPDSLQSEHESLDVQYGTIYHIYGCCPLRHLTVYWGNFT